MAELNEQARSFTDAPEVATVATIEPGGQPQLSVVWVKRDGDDIVFSTTRGRRKTDNLEADPRITVLIFKSENPYTYLEVRGTATITDDPSGDLINELANKYTGKDWAEPTPAERVIVRVTPEKVVVR